MKVQPHSKNSYPIDVSPAKSEWFCHSWKCLSRAITPGRIDTTFLLNFKIDVSPVQFTPFPCPYFLGGRVFICRDIFVPVFLVSVFPFKWRSSGGFYRYSMEDGCNWLGVPSLYGFVLLSCFQGYLFFTLNIFLMSFPFCIVFSSF